MLAGIALTVSDYCVRKQFCIFCHGELMAKKWLDSIEKQQRRSNVCDRQTDRQTDRVNDKNNILLA